MNSEKADATLGLDQALTRRDFLNGALVASGSALLAPCTPLQMLVQQSGKDWDGYGGVARLQEFPWEHLGGSSGGASDTGRGLRRHRFASRIPERAMIL
jgi:spermidine dehydrogenase